MGHATTLLFGLGPWGRDKKVNIIKFQKQDQCQRFLYQTLFWFSQIKDIKFIKLDFVLSPGSCTVPRGQKFLFFFKHGHVAYQIGGDDE